MALECLNTAKYFKTFYQSGVFHFIFSRNQIHIKYRDNVFFLNSVGIERV